MNNESYYRFKVGDIECVCISDGGSNYTPESFFNNVTKQKIEEILRQHKMPNDNIWTPYTYLFANTGDLDPPFGACGVDPTADDLPECAYPEDMCVVGKR